MRRWLKSEVNSILPVLIYFGNCTMVMYDATIRESWVNTENSIASQQILCLHEIPGLEMALPACYPSTWEAKQEDHKFEASPGYVVKSISKPINK